MPPNALVTLTALAPSFPGMSGGTGAIAAGLAIPTAAAIYFLLTWGKRSSGECSWRDDEQIGLKVIVGTLIMIGTLLFAVGLQGLLHLLMTFKNFVPTLKAVLPDLLIGVVVVGGTIMFAVPKTNHGAQPKALRLTAGAIALFGAVATVIALDDLLKTIFQWPSWSAVAGALTWLLTSVVVFGGSGYLYAKMIGVEVPDIPAPALGQQQQQAQPQAQPAPQQGYAQPQQGGYAQPQQGGYQQPQGGYQQPAPGGGGYPPQGGGGGYPPQGGGPYGQ
jgi:hypothetical protein